MKKKNKIIFIVVMLVTILSVGCFYLIKNNKKVNNKIQNDKIDNEVVKENKFAVVDAKDGHIIFGKDNEIISEYECINKGMMECQGYNEITEVYFDKNNGKILMYDGRNDGPGYKEIFLFDIENNKKLVSFKDVLGVTRVRESSNDFKDNFFVTMNNGNMGIFNTNGKMVKELSSKKYAFNNYESYMVYNDSYFEDRDMLVTIVNDKYGIERITSNDKIIDNIYDDIALWDYNYKEGNKWHNKELYSNYFKGKLGNKWRLYDINTGKSITDGYDLIYLLSDKYMLVKDNNKLIVKDINDNDIMPSITLMDTIIEDGMNRYGILINKDKDNYSITIDYENSKNDKYNIDLVNKKLNKIN